jgi:hypothetical protein
MANAFISGIDALLPLEIDFSDGPQAFIVTMHLEDHEWRIDNFGPWEKNGLGVEKLLHEPTEMEKNETAARETMAAIANALRQYVHEPSSAETGWPATGWRLVSHQTDAATFLALGPTTWWIATFANAGGGWEFSEGGACDLQVALPTGVGFASWRLDPAQPTEPDGTAVHLLGTELACANGKPPGARVLDPIVIPREEAITIALLVRGIPGGADCPGNPEFSIAISLSEPLGHRALFDGSTVPPSSRS